MDSGKGIHWGKFRNEIEKRNYSILAHGFVSVSAEQYQDFKEIADYLLALFCILEKINHQDATERYAFLKIN